MKEKKVKSDSSKSRTVSAKPAPAPMASIKHEAPTSRPAAPNVNRVFLEVTEPGARQVCVAGTFNDWKPETTPLTRDADGKWFGDLAVNPGRYEYLFVVDGRWLTDPKAKESVQNPFGGVNSVMVVSA